MSMHPFADLVGLSVTKMKDGESECRLEARPELFNPQGVMHGATLYALADTGMGGALYTLLEQGELCATIDLTISYFAAIREGEIVCKTRVLNKGKRTASMESEIYNGETLAAKAMGSFAVFRPSRKS
ncbi:MAG: PaaI family thioesterase [Chrysiogenetes bacterium]|nr:PaaI family thioesterase [Chrysiogenetes bacterium]